MAEQVAEGVFRIGVPIPIQISFLNAYLLRESDEAGGVEYTLVDTGMNTVAGFATLLSELESLGVRPSDIRRILITHYHPDHIGLLGRLHALTDSAEVVLHKWDADAIHLIYDQPQKRSAELRAWLHAQGAPPEEAGDMGDASLGLREFVSLAAATRPVETDQPLRPADPAGWQVLHTPGHTPGHIVLYHPARRLLLSGDHLLAKISSNVSTYPGSQPDPLGDYLASLDKTAALDVALVLPAHGPLFPDHRARIAYLREHHQARLDGIVTELRQSGQPMSAYALSHRIWPRRLDPFNRRLALMETVSHIERLKREARVVAAPPAADGVVRYTAV